jgi:NADH-quinone oxidoreductase subunit M
MFGDVANSHVAELSDINAREMLILGVLAICTLAMGIWPQPVTEIMHATVNQLLDHVAAGKL